MRSQSLPPPKVEGCCDPPDRRQRSGTHSANAPGRLLRQEVEELPKDQRFDPGSPDAGDSRPWPGLRFYRGGLETHTRFHIEPDCRKASIASSTWRRNWAQSSRREQCVVVALAEVERGQAPIDQSRAALGRRIAGVPVARRRASAAVDSRPGPRAAARTRPTGSAGRPATRCTRRKSSSRQSSA